MSFGDILYTKWGHRFQWAELVEVADKIDLTISAIKKLNENIEGALIKTFRDADEEYKSNKEKYKHLDEDEREMMVGYDWHEQNLIISELERQQRYGLCTSLFSSHESLLKRVCDLIQQEFALKISLEDLADRKDLARYRTYLVKVFEIDFSSAEPFYTRLDNQKNVRNKIAHDGGRMGKKVINEAPGLSISFDNEVEIVADVYVKYLLENVEAFFHKLLIAIDKRYVEVKSKAK